MKKILLTFLFILGLTAMASFGQTATATVKVGVIAPKASFSQGVDNAQMSAGIRDLIAQTFQGSNVEIVPIEAMLPNAAAQEAKDKQCAYVLQVAVSQKKGGGGFGMFKALAPVLSSVAPMAGVAGVGGQIAGSIASRAIFSAANMSSSTKSKDQFIFDYSLISTVDNSVKSTNSFKAKANSDGEDVLSPLVEKMAEAIVAATK